MIGTHWNETDIKVDDLNKEVIQTMKQRADLPEKKPSNEEIHKEKEPERKNVTTFFEEWVRFILNIFFFLHYFLQKEKIQDDTISGKVHENSESTSLPGVTEVSMNPHLKEVAHLIHSDNKLQKTHDSNEQFTLRLWDLGGQNDFRSTHHLFLDVEATTVIVMDITKEFSEKFEYPDKDLNNLKLKQSDPSSPEEIMHYWLSSLHEEGERREISPNIFIVLTHIDDYNTEIKKQDRINMYKDQIKESLKRKEYKSHAHLVTEDKIFAIDNKTGKQETFQTLKEQLFESFTQQQSWNKKPMPIKWLLHQANLLEKKEDGQKYITLMHLEEMGRSIGMDPTEVKSFLKMHNVVETFLHFNDEPQQDDGTSCHMNGSTRLKDFIVINPQWLVDMCKEVIRHPDFLNKRKFKQFSVRKVSTYVLDKLGEKGIISDDSLKKLWGDEAVAYLTMLMLKHDIFIPMAESRKLGRQYLIPCMLSMGNGSESESESEGESEEKEKIVLLYNGVHKAGCGQWFKMGTFSKLLATIIQTIIGV